MFEEGRGTDELLCKTRRAGAPWCSAPQRHWNAAASNVLMLVRRHTFQESKPRVQLANAGKARSETELRAPNPENRRRTDYSKTRMQVPDSHAF
jgi:hypothetical protein